MTSTSSKLALFSNQQQDGQSTNIKSADHLKTFMSFFYDKQSTDMTTVVKSSIELFNYCIPSREAILTFYSELFNEYSIYYWINKQRSLGPNTDPNKNRIEYVGGLSRRFYEMARLKFADAREDQAPSEPSLSAAPPPIPTSRIRATSSKSASSIADPASPTASQGCSSPTAEVAPKIIPTGPRVIPVSRRTSSCNSNDMDQTPMIPSALENETALENSAQYESSDVVVDIFPELEELILSIKSSLDNLIKRYKLQERNKSANSMITGPARNRREKLRQILTRWSSKLLIQLNIKHSEVAMIVATDQSKSDPSKILTKEIELCLGNPVNKLLLDLLLESHKDIQKLFKRLRNTTQNCDWLLAHLLVEMSKRPIYDKDFPSCMEYIMARQTTISSVDFISQFLIDKLCAAQFDLVSVSQLIKLACTSLERVDHSKICISTKHRLCMSLATSFFLLLEYNGDNFAEILSYIRISLTCMSLLKQSTVASHILCRALLERCLVYGHLFNENFNPDQICDDADSQHWSQNDYIKLSKENLKGTLGHRFRRLPNHEPERQSNRNRKQLQADQPDRQSINCYLLIEAFKSSINNIEAFASLFVEFHCPVMFDKLLWPSDEALRSIDERNLGILRKFEQIPPFWDLYELIGQSGRLENCLVLVKALLSAHLALWASATASSSPDKMASTSRLIPPLAQSGLIPKAFGLAVEIFPHLAPNEVFLVLNDIWQYLKDTSSDSEKKGNAKLYLNRLRLIMCQKTPGPAYVKIFKEFLIARAAQ